MFEKYGIVTIKKDSILFNGSEYSNLFESWRYYINPSKRTNENQNKNIPIIDMYLHPLDFDYICESYIQYIKLEKDVKLLFMINEELDKDMIKSDIDNIINSNRDIYSRIREISIIELSQLLKEENLDGYFTTNYNSKIDNNNIIIGLLNNKNIYPQTFKIIKTQKIDNRLRQLCKKKNNSKFKLCSIEKPIQFDLNIRYNDLIEKYTSKINEKIQHTSKINIFDIILENAIINYF